MDCMCRVGWTLPSDEVNRYMPSILDVDNHSLTLVVDKATNVPGEDLYSLLNPPPQLEGSLSLLFLISK